MEKIDFYNLEDTVVDENDIPIKKFTKKEVSTLTIFKNETPAGKKIERAIAKNSGYCPCKTVRNEDTKCICKEFREQESGECSCGLYSKELLDFVLFSKPGCPRCDILRKELLKNNKTFIDESENYLEDIVNLPVLIDSKGVEYDFKSAMKLFK